MSDATEKIESQIKGNKVILFMKGNREMPQCGFSARVVQILDSYDVMYETVDVLSDPEIRQGIKDYSNWPTIPQLYINGELVEKQSTTGKVFDAGLDQFGPHSRIISPYQVQSAFSFMRGGDLDELRIYDRMLTDDNIKELAQRGATAVALIGEIQRAADLKAMVASMENTLKKA